MIFANIIVLLLAQAAPNFTSQPELKEKLKIYKECVIAKSRHFERAKESISETVDGAFFACGNERAELLFKMTEIRENLGQDNDIGKADDSVSGTIDEGLREEIWIALLETRTPKK